MIALAWHDTVVYGNAPNTYEHLAFHEKAGYMKGKFLFFVVP